MRLITFALNLLVTGQAYPAELMLALSAADPVATAVIILLDPPLTSRAFLRQLLHRFIRSSFVPDMDCGAFFAGLAFVLRSFTPLAMRVMLHAPWQLANGTALKQIIEVAILCNQLLCK